MRRCLELASFLVPLTALVIGCTDSTSPLACTQLGTHAIGIRTEGILQDGDCRDEDQRPFDVYQVTLTGQTHFLVKLTPSGFEGSVGLATFPPSGGTLPNEVFSTEGTGAIGARVFLPAGTYYVGVGTTSGKGAYTLETSPTSVGDCSYMNRALPGVTIPGVIGANDCAGNGAARQDIYELTLQSGRTYTFSGTRDKAGTVALHTGSAGSAPLKEQTLMGAGSFSFSYTPTKTDFYRVHVFGEPQFQGPVGYTLTIQ